MSTKLHKNKNSSIFSTGAKVLLLLCLLQPILTAELGSEATEENNQDILINDSEGSSAEEGVPEETIEIVEDVEDDLPADPSDPRLKKKTGKAHVFMLSFLILLWGGLWLIGRKRTQCIYSENYEKLCFWHSFG